MDVLLVTTVTAVVGAGIGGAATAWWYGRLAAGLRARLERVEQARAAAHERSMQARDQIQQLSQAITELQRRHRSVVDLHSRRAELERVVPSQPAAGVASAVASHGFADTQPL